MRIGLTKLVHLRTLSIPEETLRNLWHIEKTFVFDTCDHAFSDAVLHKNLVMN